MTEGFFQLRSARDMYEKAKREFDRMKSSPNIDTVFDFYVTAHHIIDYVDKQPTVSKAAIKAFRADPGFPDVQLHMRQGQASGTHKRPMEEASIQYSQDQTQVGGSSQSDGCQ